MVALEEGKMPKTVRTKLNYTAVRKQLLMLSHGFVPEIGLVLGSGLSHYAEQALTDSHSLPYSEISHFPKPTVKGHEGGRMWWGKIGERNVVVMQGRVHGYEGYTPEEIVFPVRLMIVLGAKKIILTNAVSAIKRDFTPGDLVVVKDHNGLFCQSNPLIGPNDETLGPRFPSMNNAYDQELRAHALSCLERLGHRPLTGTYLALSGPQYETPVESQFLNGLGVDMVGMSVVPETIAAVHMSARVLAVSCVTHMASGICDNTKPFSYKTPDPSHDKVMEVSKKNEKKFSDLMTLVISTLP